MSEHDERAAPPQRDDTPEPEPAPDFVAYYVGTWDGLVNGSFPTELRVDSSGRFFINLRPNPKLKPCHLAGRLEATENTLAFHIETSTCQAESAGTTLERSVGHKLKSEFTVQNQDFTLTIRYVRRSP